MLTLLRVSMASVFGQMCCSTTNTAVDFLNLVAARPFLSNAMPSRIYVGSVVLKSRRRRCNSDAI